VILASSIVQPNTYFVANLLIFIRDGEVYGEAGAFLRVQNAATPPEGAGRSPQALDSASGGSEPASKEGRRP